MGFLKKIIKKVFNSEPQKAAGGNPFAVKSEVLKTGNEHRIELKRLSMEATLESFVRNMNVKGYNLDLVELLPFRVESTKLIDVNVVSYAARLGNLSKKYSQAEFASYLTDFCKLGSVKLGELKEPFYNVLVGTIARSTDLTKSIVMMEYDNEFNFISRTDEY